MSNKLKEPIDSDFLTEDEIKLYNKPVLATMNGTDWVRGVLVEVIDLFVPYGVKIESGQIRYFAEVKPEPTN